MFTSRCDNLNPSFPCTVLNCTVLHYTALHCTGTQGVELHHVVVGPVTLVSPMVMINVQPPIEQGRVRERGSGHIDIEDQYNIYLCISFPIYGFFFLVNHI